MVVKEYIEREAAISATDGEIILTGAENMSAVAQYITSVVERLKKLPAQPERKNGKWILDDNPHDGDCRCSVCLMAIDQMHERNHGLLNALTGGKWWTFYNFCPNCGTDMRGEQDG